MAYLLENKDRRSRLLSQVHSCDFVLRMAKAKKERDMGQLDHMQVSGRVTSHGNGWYNLNAKLT
jgi:hypothetical protein